MVQERVVIVEDVPLGNAVITVVGSEFCQRPIGDVLSAVGAVLIVGVEGKALKTITRCECVKVRNQIRHQRIEACSETVITDDYHSIVRFCLPM